VSTAMRTWWLPLRFLALVLVCAANTGEPTSPPPRALTNDRGR
jgi:hypothetical protein